MGGGDSVPPGTQGAVWTWVGPPEGEEVGGFARLLLPAAGTHGPPSPPEAGGGNRGKPWEGRGAYRF